MLSIVPGSRAKRKLSGPEVRMWELPIRAMPIAFSRPRSPFLASTGHFYEYATPGLMPRCSIDLS
jgi:hypothetical protein